MNLQPPTNPLTYDYSRSFLQWTGQSAHVPRCAIHASCRLRAKNGSEREFFLTHPCAAETMYVDLDLIHIPTAEFHMISEPGKEYLAVKVFADEPTELRMAHRIGETLPTRDGRGARIARMEVKMRSFAAVRELTTDQAVCEAMLANLPVTGRSTFLADDRETLVICEYPVTVMNARPSDQRWQVDTGPVLLPDFTLKSELVVGLFRQAYLVYNRRDWAEVAMRRPTPAAKNGNTVMHYTSPQRLTMQNQLFAASLES